MVFGRIREARFDLNLEKCTVAADVLAYLGHQSANAVSPDANRVKAFTFFPLR
jgi:hypothetical protein